MAYENTGLLAFANSLNNAGQMFGNALQQRFQQQSLASLAPLAKNQDWAGLSEEAFKMGNVDLGLKALAQAQEVKKLEQQRLFDNQALGMATGGGAGAQQGVTGGVTPNPNPQPMPLSGASLSQAIIGQESGGNPNIGKSVNGAMGIGQIMPETFARYAKPGERIDNPQDNLAVSQRMTDLYLQKYGDPARAAVAYFSGEGNVAPPGNPTPWKNNAKDGNGKSVSSYVADVLGRMNKGVQVADASGAVPARAMPQQAPQQSPVDGLMAKRQNILRALSAQGISDNARQQLNTLLKDTEFQIERADKTANNPAKKLQNDVAQRGALADQYGLQGEDATRYKLTGNLPTKSEKAPTESQSKNAVYYTENIANHEILNSPEALAGGTGVKGALGRSVAELPGVGPSLTPEDTGKFKQAADNFVSNVVYAKSGASATKAEYDRAYNNYIPTPFDKPALIEQKAKARERWLEQMKVSSGPGVAKSETSSQSLKAPSAYDMQKAQEALAAGRSREEVTNFLRSRGMSADGLF
jgi:hypothetical protein